MEKGFYHPSWGYWQTLTDPSAEIVTTYPDGTVEVPLKPGGGYDWNGSEWIYTFVEPEESDESSAE